MSDTSTGSPFVRVGIIPPQSPPKHQVAAISWLKENLFSSPLNIALTLGSIWFIWAVLDRVVPWLWFSVWDAASLTECREIMDERLGEGVRSACFAVIADRWQQLVFGFYPKEGYWRPPTALAVFLVAIAPVLFTQLPRKMLWFSLVSPFLIYFLLWGGSIWGPVSVGIGAVLGWVSFRVLSQHMVGFLTITAAIGIAILYWLFIDIWVASVLTHIVPLGLPAVKSEDFGGFTLSIVIGLSAIMLSLPLGILLALGRKSEMFIISKLSVTFIEVIRGVPLIVWLFTAQLLLNYFLPKGTNFDLMLRVIIMVTLFSAAYLAEVIRGGLAALPRGQYEAADALGLDYWQSMRLIILPQALKISIPGIVNSYIGLFKDTTLVVFIGMYDPIGLARSIRASTDWNGVYWEIYVFIALIFFVFCYAMSRYSMYLERKLQRDQR
jgi:general L-amino acid transport system permease protein